MPARIPDNFSYRLVAQLPKKKQLCIFLQLPDEQTWSFAILTGSLICFSPPSRQWYCPGLTRTTLSPRNTIHLHNSEKYRTRYTFATGVCKKVSLHRFHREHFERIATESRYRIRKTLVHHIFRQSNSFKNLCTLQDTTKHMTSYIHNFRITL